MINTSIPALVQNLRTHFNTGCTHPLKWRQQQLEGLARFLKDCQPQIEQTLSQDLGRRAVKAFAADIRIITTELNYTRKGLVKWLKPQRIPTPLATQPDKGLKSCEVVWVNAPWSSA